MAAVTICSDFGAQKNKVWHCFHCFPIYFPWSDGTGYVTKPVHLKWEINFWRTPFSGNKNSLEFRNKIFPGIEQDLAHFIYIYWKGKLRRKRLWVFIKIFMISNFLLYSLSYHRSWFQIYHHLSQNERLCGDLFHVFWNSLV